MSLPTVNLSAWGVPKHELLSPPPAPTHINKRFLNPNKRQQPSLLGSGRCPGEGTSQMCFLHFQFFGR